MYITQWWREHNISWITKEPQLYTSNDYDLEKIMYTTIVGAKTYNALPANIKHGVIFF